MQVFRQELNAFPLGALLDQAADELGAPGLDGLLGSYGVSRRDLSDSANWVSVEFVGALLADIVSHLSGDSAFLERAAARGMSPRYMGPLYPFAIGFGSPLFVYRQLPRNAARFDKLGSWRFARGVPGAVQLVWTPDPGAPVAQYLCRFRSVQLARVPTLFSRPPAQVSHPRCVFRGDSECVYDIRWLAEPPRSQPRVGALLGAGVAGAFGVLGGMSVGGALLLAPLLIAGGWALGKVHAQRQELAVRLRDLHEHHQALERSTERNEERYAELLEAKQAIEEKVDERTRELRVTAQQLSQTLQKVQELDRVRTDFFSNVSHELRTPLTLLLGTLGELVDGREPPGGMARAL
jgi:hypothetical protein